MAAARLRARPAGALGAIASAGIILFLLDPSVLSRPGFQLSFAGALGLVLLRPPVRRWLDVRSLSVVPPALKDAVAAGAGATLATIPFVAFHFGRVSIVGVPVTLVATPLVSAAIPGLLSAIGMSWISPPLAQFLAGGTDVLLRALESFARLCASPPLGLTLGRRRRSAGSARGRSRWPDRIALPGCGAPKVGALDDARGLGHSGGRTSAAR